MRTLRFGMSPCPNDTFAFHAVTHGLVDTPLTLEPVLLDIEELNRRATRGEFPLTKLSTGAFAGNADRYRLISSGAALGRGAGPLVVARTPMSLRRAAAGRIAIPGWDTTAVMLLRLEADLGDAVEMRYDRVLRAVADGEVDAGLIIHESRFSYRDHGLVQVADLGERWEARSGLPVPLAGICVRRDVPEDVAAEAESAIRESVRYAFAHPEACRDWVRANAQEMSDAMCDAHIGLYVTDFSVDIGTEGRAAIDALVAAATTPG